MLEAPKSALFKICFRVNNYPPASNVRTNADQKASAPRNGVQEIVNSFFPINSVQKQKDVYKSEYAESKQSFFDLKLFKRWVNGDFEFLWCHGIAGSGKTVLTSMIFEYLRSIQPPTARVGIACIYCDNQQRGLQTTENLVSSLWPQLCTSGDNGAKPLIALKNLYPGLEREGFASRPTLDQIQYVIQSIIQHLEKTYILIDGLDECADADQQQNFMDSITAIVRASNAEGNKVRVLVTSRLEEQLVEEAQSVNVQATDEEIKRMVEARIKNRKSFRKGVGLQVANNPGLQIKIRDTVMAKAKGMFLMANLIMESLKTAVSITNLRDILEKPPQRLDEYYEAAWLRITRQEPNSRELAQYTIAWIFYARRLLRNDELQHALAVRLGDKAYNAESLSETTSIAEVCHGLIRTEQQSQTVRLTHSTLYDFFRRRENDFLRPYHQDIAKKCIVYLSFDDFEKPTCDFASDLAVKHYAKPGEKIKSGRILTNRLRAYPFLDYAAENWGFHASGDAEKECLELICSFLSSHNPLYNAHMVHPQVFHPSNRGHLSNDCADVHPLRVAISFGLDITACMFIDVRRDELAKESPLASQMLVALLEAIEAGRLQVVRQLIEAGMGPSLRDKPPSTILDRTYLWPSESPKTALDRSIYHGHIEIASLLVNEGAEITYRTLQYIVSVGNCGMLQGYADAATNEDERSERMTQVLLCACKMGKLDFIKFSLSNGALIEAYEDDGTLLSCAVIYGQAGAVKYLLDAGADTSVEFLDGIDDYEISYNPLQLAASCVQVFKDRLDFICNDFTLAFSFSRLKNTDITRLEKSLRGWLTVEPQPLKLLENQEFLSAVRDDGEYCTILDLLLTRGMEISIREGNEESLLHLAVFSRPRLAVLLHHLKRQSGVGLDIDARDKYGRTPLHHAAVACNPAAMEILIGNGADAKLTDNEGITVLHFAIFSPPCIRIALEHGCPINSHAYLGTPLQLAKHMEDPNTQTVDLLESITEGTRVSEILQNSLKNAILPEMDRQKSMEVRFWMQEKKEKHAVVCEENIRDYLANSHQENEFHVMNDSVPLATRALNSKKLSLTKPLNLWLKGGPLGSWRDRARKHAKQSQSPLEQNMKYIIRNKYDLR